jgi:hypothetical protein
MSNADSNSKHSLILEGLRHKPISDAIADLAEIAGHLVAAHEDTGDVGNHGGFLLKMMLRDNLEMIGERARIKPAI